MMNDQLSTRAIRLRLLASTAALCCGIAALVVAILLVRGVLS
jgi:hypothetical protein